MPYLITGKDNTSLGFGDYTGRSVVDTSLHWAYSLHGYEQYSIDDDGVPIVAHVHGGHSDFQFDGNPEFFFSPGWTVRGPQWVDKKYLYDNSQPAGTVWYHDHALGITRLNVYAGMAGFYIIRDDFDTGLLGNPLDLPAFPYEAAFAIQDRMFKDNGEFFYPAFPGDPFYADFITGEGAVLPPDIFPGGGPTGLAEFFGDHMVVNGNDLAEDGCRAAQLPAALAERLLTAASWRCSSSRFLPGATDFSTVIDWSTAFTVIGSDQGLASSPTDVDTLLMETGSRYDIIFDFSTGSVWQSGDHEEHRWRRAVWRRSSRDRRSSARPTASWPSTSCCRSMPRCRTSAPTGINFGPVIPPDRLRKVALFEGMDEFGRLQPLLGTAEPATDYLETRSTGRATPEYSQRRYWLGRWRARSPGTARRPRIRPSTPPRSGRSGTSPATPIRCTCTWCTSRSWVVRRSCGTATRTRTTALIPNDDYDTPAGDGTYLVTSRWCSTTVLLRATGFKIVNRPTEPRCRSRPSTSRTRRRTW